jgi:hypothetical protein
VRKRCAHGFRSSSPRPLRSTRTSSPTVTSTSPCTTTSALLAFVQQHAGAGVGAGRHHLAQDAHARCGRCRPTRK